MKNIIYLLLFLSFPSFSYNVCSQQIEYADKIIQSSGMIKEVSSSKMLHFYIAPINSCARSDFIIKGDRVISYKTYNNFDYITYVTKGGETVTGWIKNSDLDAIEPSQTELNASDFSLKIQGVNVYLNQSIVNLNDLAKPKEIELNLVGNTENGNVYGVSYPSDKHASVYASEINSAIKANGEESVSQLSIYDGEYSTSRGVHVGDSLHEVINKYGEYGIAATDNDTKYLKYQHLDMNINFTYGQDNKVSLITYNVIPWQDFISELTCSRNTNLEKPAIQNLECAK